MFVLSDTCYELYSIYKYSDILTKCLSASLQTPDFVTFFVRIFYFTLLVVDIAVYPKINIIYIFNLFVHLLYF